MKPSAVHNDRAAWPELPMLRKLHSQIRPAARSILRDLAEQGPVDTAELRDRLSRHPDDLILVHQFLSSIHKTPFRGRFDSIPTLPDAITDALLAERFGREQLLALRAAADDGWPVSEEIEHDSQWSLTL